MKRKAGMGLHTSCRSITSGPIKSDFSLTLRSQCVFSKKCHSAFNAAMVKFRINLQNIGQLSFVEKVLHKKSCSAIYDCFFRLQVEFKNSAASYFFSSQFYPSLQAWSQATKAMLNICLYVDVCSVDLSVNQMLLDVFNCL